MKVLGVSWSPIKNSNTDRALKAVLNATGYETEFVKLIDYTVAPCKACIGCVKTNKCVIKDDGIELAEKAKAADALVIAGELGRKITEALKTKQNHPSKKQLPGTFIQTSLTPNLIDTGTTDTHCSCFY